MPNQQLANALVLDNCEPRFVRLDFFIRFNVIPEAIPFSPLSSVVTYLHGREPIHLEVGDHAIAEVDRNMSS
jgi:hypothetical protein